MIELNRLFDIEYGNQADLNKLERTSSSKGIRFISRSSENLGFQCYVKRDKKLKVYSKGLITVTLGGTYVLSAFVQPDDFYTGQNIKVLTPKVEMSDVEKYFYCFAIASNRFRYTSHGREANKTLDNILVPDLNEIPEWVYEEISVNQPDAKPYHSKIVSLTDRNWEWFEIGELFDVKYGVNMELNKMTLKPDGIPFVSRTSTNNGVSANVEPIEGVSPNPANTISISGGGSVLECFVQELPYYSGRDLFYLKPKTEVNKAALFFICTIIKQEKYRFNYGRQANKSLRTIKIKLPAINGSPDWDFMEYYIKSLPYSSALDNTKPNKGLSDEQPVKKYESGKVNLKVAVNNMLKEPSQAATSKSEKQKIKR